MSSPTLRNHPENFICRMRVYPPPSPSFFGYTKGQGWAKSKEYCNNSWRGIALSSSLKFEPFADLFLALGIACAHIWGVLRRWGPNISLYYIYIIFFLFFLFSFYFILLFYFIIFILFFIFYLIFFFYYIYYILYLSLFVFVHKTTSWRNLNSMI